MSTKTSLQFIFSFALLVVLSSTASAALQAADVGLSTISPCPSFCGGSGGMSDFAFDGGPGFSSAAATLSNSDGTAEGIANLNGSLLLPVLGSKAISHGNSRAGASATGMKSYDYNGETSTTISLDFDFDGIASAPVDNDARAVATVVVMKGSDFPFSTDPGTLIFEELDFNPDADLVDYEELYLVVNAGQQSLAGSISIDLDPGDRIAVWAQVSTSGTRGGSADALNTLTSQFSDPTGLSPLGVPSPSSGVLLCLGLATIGLFRRNSASFV